MFHVQYRPQFNKVFFEVEVFTVADFTAVQFKMHLISLAAKLL